MKVCIVLTHLLAFGCSVPSRGRSQRWSAKLETRCDRS